MMRKLEDEEEVTPATQPVMSLLLSEVVAYVEVRSGHDNRSRGVKTQLRNLGASIAETFTNDVTHVVFNEGLPSTYKKAQKLNCHLVSVLWIEACKEQLTKVSEGGYPPIGKQIYENPRSLKNFKKLKSMQPDFDEEEANRKTEKILKQIQRRGRKAKTGDEKLSQPTDSNQEKATIERGRKKCVQPKGSKKKTALREITPEVVNKDSVNTDAELQSAMDTTSKAQTANILKAGNESSSSLLESASSSSSVIFVEEAVEAGSSTIRPKKSKESNVSRADFVDGLSKIVFSLSKENQKTGKLSPWRKRPFAPASKIDEKKLLPTTSPRRSPRYSAGSSPSPVALKKSPRHLKDLVSKKTEIKAKFVAPACVSASATLNRRRKIPSPPLPDEDFLLLSQEPGDMPTIDEMAKMNRVSIHLGEEKINLSQVVRAYDAVAQGQYKTSSQSSESIYLSCQVHSDSDDEGGGVNVRPGKHEINVSNKNDLMMVNSEDMSCDTEIARHCENRSDAGSSVSSFSTKVLINGMLTQTSKVTKLSSALPGSEGMDCEDTPHQVNDDVPPEREPSPIFLIKKPKLRKPFKKPSGGSTVLSAVQTDTVKNTGKASEYSTEDDVINSPEQRRSSLNPIDYINKLFLPKFLSPAAKEEEIFVEETPDAACSIRKETGNIVIPPTPAENSPEPRVMQSVASPSPSLTSSVLSWVRKSCKVPLFAPRTHGDSESTSGDVTPKVPTDLSSKRHNKSQRSNSCEESKKIPGQLESAILKEGESVMSTVEQTKESPQPPSSRKERLFPYQSSNCKSIKNLKSSHKAPNTTKAQASSEYDSIEGGTSVCTRRKSGRVLVSVVKNKDVESSDNMRGKGSVDSKLSPIIVLHKTEDIHCSSGYDTSHSSNNGENKKLIPSESNIKRKKPFSSLSPARSKANERSDFKDCDQASTEESSTRKSGRKRTQADQNLASKKSRLVPSSPETKGSHVSRADSKRRIESLSFEGAKPSERKSSEEAKKRMAKSLTRAPASNVPKLIVCTFLTASEQNGIDIAGDSLLGWKHEDKVTARTTHVINSGPKRTLNMLKGMARGCWLVDQRWMLDSAKAGLWLAEDKYELLEFSPAVKQCRLKRQLLGKEFKHSLFSQAGPIFVSSKTEAPPAKDVKELLELCSADVKTSPTDCKIIVGENLNHKGNVKCVNPLWVLDCITKNKILSVNSPNYQIK